MAHQDLITTARQNEIKKAQSDQAADREIAEAALRIDLNKANDGAIRAERAEATVSALLDKKGDELVVAKAAVAGLERDTAHVSARREDTQADLAAEKARSAGLLADLEKTRDENEIIARKLDLEVYNRRSVDHTNRKLYLQVIRLTKQNEVLRLRTSKLDAELVTAQKNATIPSPSPATPATSDSPILVFANHSTGTEDEPVHVMDVKVASPEGAVDSAAVENDALEAKVTAPTDGPAPAPKEEKEELRLQDERLAALERRIAVLEGKVDEQDRALPPSPLSNTTTLCSSPESSSTTANSPESSSSPPAAGLAITLTPSASAAANSSSLESEESQVTPRVSANRPSKRARKVAGASKERALPAAGPTVAQVAHAQNEVFWDHTLPAIRRQRRGSRNRASVAAVPASTPSVLADAPTDTVAAIAGPSRSHQPAASVSVQATATLNHLPSSETPRPRSRGDKTQPNPSGSSSPSTEKDAESSEAANKPLGRLSRKPLQERNGEDQMCRGGATNPTTSPSRKTQHRHLSAAAKGPSTQALPILEASENDEPEEGQRLQKDAVRPTNTPQVGVPIKVETNENLQRLLKEAHDALRGPDIPLKYRLAPLGITPPKTRKRGAERPMVLEYPWAGQTPDRLLKAPMANLDNINEAYNPLWSIDPMAESSHKDVMRGSKGEDDVFEDEPSDLHILSGLTDSPLVST